MLKSIIIAGAGGQGNIFAGEVFAVAVLKENKNVTFFPSYGPQMRGGKSTCTVVISDEEIGSPIISTPDALIVMNEPSLDFIKNVRRDGLVIINSSLSEYRGQRKDLCIINVNTAPILEKLNSSKVLNMILLGVYLKVIGIVSIENALAALEEKLKEEGKGRFLEINRQALMVGYDLF